MQRDPKQMAMVGGAVVTILAAIGLGIRQCASMANSSPTFEHDPETKKRVDAYTADIVALEAMDVATLKAEIKKRDAALQAAKRGTDSNATQLAEEAWVRAMESLTQRPSK